MGSSDNFCLRWNDFEQNISTSFRELREDSEFFDVSLCCDNGIDVIPAHKVILAACSPLFRKILSRQKSHQPSPFLYLKGIHLKELQAVLNFIYHGEVNVAQDALNAFLAVAEELAIKGLTSDSKPGSEKNSAPNLPTLKKALLKRKPQQNPSSIDPSPSNSTKKPKISAPEDIICVETNDENTKSIKAEPEPSGSGVSQVITEGPEGAGPEGAGPDLGESSYLGDPDGNGDFGPEDFENFEQQYGEFDDSMNNAMTAAGGSSAAGDVKGPQYTPYELAIPTNFKVTTNGSRVTRILIDHMGHSYSIIKKLRNNIECWRCSKRITIGCPTYTYVKEGWILGLRHEHNHEPVFSLTD